MVITTNYNFIKIKRDLIISCKKQDIDSVISLSSPKVKNFEYGLIFILNKELKTAIVFKDLGIYEEIIIPQTIFYDSNEYIVADISKNPIICDEDSGSFSKIDSIKFLSDIVNFSMGFLNYSKITSITIPVSLEEFQINSHFNTPSLTTIKVPPTNKNFIFYDNSYLIGKSDKKSDIFDVLYFVRRNIEFAFIPSFVKYVEQYSFDNCDNLISVEFPVGSELKTISKNAFFDSPLKQITLPSSIEELQSGWHNGFSNLNFIKIVNNEKKNIALYSRLGNKFFFLGNRFFFLGNKIFFLGNKFQNDHFAFNFYFVKKDQQSFPEFYQNC
ncbi:hypothetical protein M9Y10_007069 [Tritrichomonas musculus]|uniref:Surface antigen BspA-like n=1 Tax=Tritrichomonas musculus TaxID=1915356 RepID=A0ABR2J0B1_9EUKA